MLPVRDELRGLPCETEISGRMVVPRAHGLKGRRAARDLFCFSIDGLRRLRSRRRNTSQRTIDAHFVDAVPRSDFGRIRGVTGDRSAPNDTLKLLPRTATVRSSSSHT